MAAPNAGIQDGKGRRKPGNRLLGSLSADDWKGVGPLLERVDLIVDQVVESARHNSQWLHFPESSIIAVENRLAEGRRVVVGSIGNEGMCGLPAWLETNADDGEALCHVAGAALRGRAADIILIAERRPAIRRLLSRYTGAYLGVVAQSSACNRLHDVEQRCARWLLTTHDRLANRRLLLRRDLLATMLGVPDDDVTVAVQALRSHGLIRASRHRIDIMDRGGLERMSCECYRIVRSQFDRIA